MIVLLLAFGPLADLLVWQDDTRAEIEVVCAAPCPSRIENGDLFLDGVTDDFAVDLRDGPLARIEVSTAGEASRLRFETSRPVQRAELTACGAAKACLTLTYAVPTLRERLSDASGDALTGADCTASMARLQSDPWNLDAFRQIAQCEAVAGDLSGAARQLGRLLAYRDDPAAARAAAVLQEQLEAAPSGG